jgi:hypothetical protein
MTYQLHYHDNQMNPFHIWVSDDPVRPNIPTYQRYGHNRGVFFLTDNQHSAPRAIACCSFIAPVPKTEQELMDEWEAFDVAVFYTVWSGIPTDGRNPKSNGAGRTIINKALNHIRWFKPFVKMVVTLSPKTEMARKFHLSNGATLFRENEHTINYEYKL